MSTVTRAQHAAEIVKCALERDASDWPAFLDESCGADAALRAEVESLLRFQREATQFIEQPAVQIAAEMIADDSTLPPGQHLGHYRIESLIGTGGMGEVYLATDTELKRQVALKLVQRGLNTQAILRRFRQEEEILAGLNHPNIAQLYGSGVTDDGVPFFAMEYVNGVSLLEFCDGRALGVAERLQLFRKICAAVGYAHQHLVIHRDLKPANIRVTADGEPKLLDFGIAKILDAANSDAAEQTITIERVMTPEYASPEQVRGDTMTTASDVYSLGVVLYELLTGRKPYRLTNRTADELNRAITSQAPAAPSTVVDANAKTKIENRKSLRGDLDNIVLMALRKEPERRYASVALLADDIRRHLEGRTVLARKDTVGYRASKFIRRNRAGVAAAALVFLTLVGGIIATTYEARRAQHRFDEVRRLANSLMFEIHDSVQNLEGSTPTRRLIVDRALEYLDSLSSDGGSDASLQRELATAYEKVGDIQGNPYSANLGDTDGALASYRKATSIRERLAKSDAKTETQLDLARSYRGMGDIMEQKGDVAECLRYYRQSLELIQQLATAHPDDASVQDELGRAYDTLGDGLGRTNATGEQLPLYQQALAIRERLSAQNPSDVKQKRGMALAHLKVGGASTDKNEAVDHMQRGAMMLEELAAADPQNARARREVAFAYYRFGRMLADGGDHAAARSKREKSLAIREGFARQDPQNRQARFDLAVAHGELSENLTNLRRPAEALDHAHQSLVILDELVASDPTNAVYQRNIGLCYEYLGSANAAAAVNESAPTPERVERWKEAGDWYTKARDLFAALRDRGALMPSDAGQVDKFAARVAEARQAIDRLRR